MVKAISIPLQFVWNFKTYVVIVSSINLVVDLRKNDNIFIRMLLNRLFETNDSVEMVLFSKLDT